MLITLTKLSPQEQKLCCFLACLRNYQQNREDACCKRNNCPTLSFTTRKLTACASFRPCRQQQQNHLSLPKMLRHHLRPKLKTDAINGKRKVEKRKQTYTPQVNYAAFPSTREKERKKQTSF